MESQTLPSYGQALADELRSNLKGTPSDFEKFVLDRGHEYKTQDALESAYDRKHHSDHGVLLTPDEFIAETGKNCAAEDLKIIYAKLKRLYDLHRLTPKELYNFARFKWCLWNPEAIIACQVGKDRWIVNNCDTEISPEKVKIEINSVWGFETSGIELVETPYYESSDHQFVRFNVRGREWLYYNDELFQIWE